MRAEMLVNVKFWSNPGSVMLWQSSQTHAHFEDFISNWCHWIKKLHSYPDLI